MSELVTIYHPNVKGSGHVPRTALDRYVAKGWQIEPVEANPNLPAEDGEENPPEASKPRPLSPKRSNA